MKLSRLELSGFKSFAGLAELPFDAGVTAIVGPNGCGKSNISDAVRWVLGEQSPRLLRGGKMEDVIFQGSTGRRPVNVAEVSLVFDNGDGSLPLAYQEVVVTRRLARSGQSEYLLNRQPVRLRDIQDLLRGTGLGADAAVVMEARMIDALLSEKAEERRSLFEEAAGQPARRGPRPRGGAAAQRRPAAGQGVAGSLARGGAGRAVGAGARGRGRRAHGRRARPRSGAGGARWADGAGAAGARAAGGGAHRGPRAGGGSPAARRGAARAGRRAHRVGARAGGAAAATRPGGGRARGARVGRARHGGPGTDAGGACGD